MSLLAICRGRTSSRLRPLGRASSCPMGARADIILAEVALLCRALLWLDRCVCVSRSPLTRLTSGGVCSPRRIPCPPASADYNATQTEEQRCAPPARAYRTGCLLTCPRASPL